ncbi:phage minor capsid protein 2 [Anaerotignum neopropionicum]|uniref:Phage minor capsid protein 2 n=1 Tax=Anaerotignum neopropionicum TaxID=36847 RepID=A0A136WBX5_9FIRM|nr:phage minor capsid protein [Anaerotignum neopropionicum]KXL52002.1 phage minor capsid protein 2 [Anaerotignum neopropionicum]
MLTEDELSFLADVFGERFGAVGAKLLNDMAVSLKETGDLIPSYANRLQQLYKYGYDTDLISKELARETGKSLADIEKMFQSVAQEGYDWVKPFYDAKGIKQIPLAENVALQTIIKSAAKTTRNSLLNLSNTTIVGIGGGKDFQPIAKFYQKTVDKAITAAATGALDYNSAIKEAVKEMANSGLRIQYEKGYTKRLDSAVRQNVLDGISYIAQETAKATGEEFGADGVEISAHSPCAPDHLPYQGNQYSTKDFDKLQGQLKRPIGNWNCRHIAYPILLGISSPANSKAELAEMQRYSNEKIAIDGNEYTRYECTQIQRKLETSLRYTREEKQLFQAVKDADGTREATERIRFLSGKYKEVGEKADLPTKAERTKTIAAKMKEKSFESGITSKKNAGFDNAKVDIDFINSSEYKDKFKHITNNAKVNTQIYDQARAMLIHRKGTYNEDLCLINSLSGKVVGRQVNSNVVNNVVYNRSLNKAIAESEPFTLISVHNHPTNIPPTGKDFTSNGSHKYNLGIVACHDGTVYTYKSGNKIFTSGLFDKRVEKYKKVYYNSSEVEVHEMVLDEFVKEYGIEWSKIK